MIKTGPRIACVHLTKKFKHMKTERFQSELEKIIEDLGYQLRKEKGSFQGDFCVLDGDKIVMINKNYPAEFHIGQMVRFLSERDINDIYIKPAVRKELDKWMERIFKKEKANS